MRPDAPYFILLNLSNSKRNFTCQGESAATQQVIIFYPETSETLLYSADPAVKNVLGL
jgi:hypothetical protein